MTTEIRFFALKSNKRYWTVDRGAPICNTVLQHFSCNMFDAIKTIPLYTRNGQVGEHVLWLCFLALNSRLCELRIDYLIEDG